MGPKSTSHIWITCLLLAIFVQNGFGLKKHQVQITNNLENLVLKNVAYQSSDSSLLSPQVTYGDGKWQVSFDCRGASDSQVEISWRNRGRILTSGSDWTITDSEDVNGIKSSELTIGDFRYQLADVYSCYISDASLSDVTTPSYSPAVVPVIRDVVSQTVDGDVMVTVVCNGPKDTPLYWRLPGEQEVSSVVISNDTNAENSTTTVTFQKTASNTYLDYQCCASLRDIVPVSIVQCASFQVEGEPRLSSYAMDCDTVVCNLTCEILGVTTDDTGAPNTNWSRCDSEDTCTGLLPSFVSFSGTQQLHTELLNVPLESGVSYQCVASNDNGVTKQAFELQADTRPPTIVSTSAVTEASTFSYECEFDGSPPPDVVYWVREDLQKQLLGVRNYTQTEERYKIETTNVSDTGVRTSLKITSWTAADVANIYCCGENLAGSVQSVALVNYDPILIHINITIYSYGPELRISMSDNTYYNVPPTIFAVLIGPQDLLYTNTTDSRYVSLKGTAVRDTSVLLDLSEDNITTMFNLQYFFYLALTPSEVSFSDTSIDPMPQPPTSSTPATTPGAARRLTSSWTATILLGTWLVLFLW